MPCLSGWRSAAESALEADCKDRRNAVWGISLPKREVLLLQVDLYHPPQEKWDHCKLDRLLEQMLYFLLASAAEQEYEVFWQEQEQLCRMQISRVQELWVFLKRLCLTATKEELEQNGKQSRKQSAGEISIRQRIFWKRAEAAV